MKKKYAVIGHPIGHTMSPFIHNRLFSLSGIDVDYSVFDIENLENSIDKLKSLDGFNVTIPHKSAIIPFLDELSKGAEICGSVNTISNISGKLCGDTTDGAGFLKALDSYDIDISGKNLILGSGGAARAIAFEIVEIQKYPKIYFACRENSIAKTEFLVAELKEYANSCKKEANISFFTYGELSDSDKKFDLLINATSVGMSPKVGMSPVGKEVLKNCKAVFDAVYNPTETELIKLANSLKIKTVGGMEMLVYQAVRAHEIWYGAKFSVQETEKLCKDAEIEMKRIFVD